LNRGLSPVLAVLLLILVTVSLASILFLWGQDLLASTSEAILTHESAMAQLSRQLISIEAVSFCDAMYFDGWVNYPRWPPQHGVGVAVARQAVKIVVRNLGKGEVEVGAVYFGPLGKARLYRPFKVLHRDNWQAPTCHCAIGDPGDDTVWYVSSLGTEEGCTPGTGCAFSAGRSCGYQGTLTTIYAEYRNIRRTFDTTQKKGTAWVYSFKADGSPCSRGILQPKGFAVIHLYLEKPWTPGETYLIKVATKKGRTIETVATPSA